ncbi:MAG: glycogen debranching N-terminal domain-containing protein [Rhodospirillales bacterium]
MSFKVQVGPPRIAIHRAMTLLVADADGQMSGTDRNGLFFNDTRIVKTWRATVNGAPWDVLSGGAIGYDVARVFLTNAVDIGETPRRTLSFVVGRSIDGGMHEDLDITNHGQQPVRFELQIRIETDFADLFDVKAGRSPQRGTTDIRWSRDSQILTAIYRNEDFQRGLVLTVDGAHASYDGACFAFAIALRPGESWHACLRYSLTDGAETIDGPFGCAEPSDNVGIWRDGVLKIDASDTNLHQFCAQATDDLAALRLPMQSGGETVTMPAAGLPWFVVPFGRDSLIVSLQAMSLYRDFALGSLAVLGQWQAISYDDRRDAEPGKIMHELRYGELAHFKLVPHTPYYGTADATPLFLITLHEAWKATGDRALLERYLPNAEAALRWIDNDGDRDGDGFQEYLARTPAGYENMAWKDSGDAINHPDGRPVTGAKALCELQGYVYDAWIRMAEICDALERPDQAAALRAKAVVLREKFDATYWDNDEGFYALTLDGAKQAVFSVASNPGHLLWSGIVPKEKAARVVERLMADDMFSGWGIRTLSSKHVRYNPYSYQNGSVWPHDNSLIALGMCRYGFHAQAATVARAVSDAASYFQAFQIPELYAGLQRDPMGFPVRYAGANVPQGWAAGSAFALLQALLGIAPDAPNDTLYLDPHLPEWLTEVTLRDLRCGARVYDIVFRRDAAPEILRGDPATVKIGVRPGSEPR